MTEKRSRITALLSIAATSAFLTTGCTDAEIHAILGEPSSSPAQQTATAEPNNYPGDPISRDIFGALYQLGGGVDSQGYFQKPISTQYVYGQRIDNGTITHPAEWSPNDLGFKYYVEDGEITGMEFVYGEAK